MRFGTHRVVDAEGLVEKDLVGCRHSRRVV